MTSRVADILLLTSLLIGCDRLEPEKQKKRTPDALYQELSVSVTYDESLNQWSYVAQILLHLEGANGEVMPLIKNETVTINGTAAKNRSGENVYSISGTEKPSETFTFVWNTEDGQALTNECAWNDFVMSNVAPSQSRSASFTVNATLPVGRGTVYGHFFQYRDDDSGVGNDGGYRYSDDNPSDMGVSLTFTPTELEFLRADEATFYATWRRDEAMANVTAAGGSCGISMTHKRNVIITE